MVKAACDRLQTAGYLDDLRFAQGMLARYQKKYGLLRIKRELFMKGIAADIVEEVLSQGDGDAQLDAAILQAQKTLRKKSADPQADYRRAYAAHAHLAADRPEPAHLTTFYLVVAVGYVVAFLALIGALRAGLALGVAYGIWAAAGVALTALASRVLFDEPLTRRMLAGIGLIVVGVLAIELGAAASH